MATRNEIIYQSIALFTSNTGESVADGTLHANQIQGLQRVTDINWGGEVARQDINCMGKLAATSREIIEEPTVNLDFTYYLANGFNEWAMGLTVGNTTGAWGGQGMNDSAGQSHDGSAGGNTFPHVINPGSSMISGVLADAFGSSEKNYYIVTVAQGEDADSVDMDGIAATGYGVVGIGNAFMSDYTVNLAVGDIPNVAVSFDAANLTFNTLSGYVPSGGAPAVTPGGGTGGFQNPAIKREESTDLTDLQYTGAVILPDWLAQNATGGNVDDVNYREITVSALRPGDVVLSFDTTTLSAGGVLLPGMTTNKQTAHVQSVSINIPMSRTPLTRLGNPFAFARKIDVPINTSITVSASVGDITTGSLVDLLCDDDPGRTIDITLGERCGASNNCMYRIKGAKLDSQSMSVNIGDSETVDLTFTAQIGGYNDITNGVFMSGGQGPISGGNTFTIAN